MIALGSGAGLTAFNYLFGQSLDASKYVTSTMLFVYIVIIIGMVWSIRFKTISPHNHRKILRFFYLVVGLVVVCRANWPTVRIRILQNVNCSSSRETRQVVLPNRDVTVCSRPSFRYAVRF